VLISSRSQQLQRLNSPDVSRNSANSTAKSAATTPFNFSLIAIAVAVICVTMAVDVRAQSAAAADVKGFAITTSTAGATNTAEAAKPVQPTPVIGATASPIATVATPTKADAAAVPPATDARTPALTSSAIVNVAPAPTAKGGNDVTGATVPAATAALPTPVSSVVPTATAVISSSTLTSPPDASATNAPAPVVTTAEPPASGSAQMTGASPALPATVVVAPEAATTESVVIPTAPPADLWDRIRAGYAMPDLEDELVGKWEKYYADRPDYMARIVDRSGKYMFYIVTELERRGMPLEIALLPMIESAFNPIANSTAKASGIWQFIPSTGTAFGMKQDWWADSRRDIVAATNGALDYLTKLHGMFGDWQLALASYNWGEGAVGRASARAKASGRDGSYLTLNMPAETRNYLPKLQAVKNIIRNPSAYGLTIASIPNEPYFKTITLSHAIDLKKAAQLAGMTETDFVALNPSHNRPVIAGRGDFQILLPADKADAFLSRLEADEKPKVSWAAYRTRPGDRLEALAARFGTTVAALKSVNGIRAVAPTLPAGYHLLVPSDGPSSDALGSIQNAVFTKFPEYVAPRSHKVRKGETFAGIAKRYGVAPATLAQWNRMSKQSARAGQTLYVSGPAPTRAAKASRGGRVVLASKGAKSVRKGIVSSKRGGAKATRKKRR
jgi:membrane-bound lytic murein transglycosylase D